MLSINSILLSFLLFWASSLEDAGHSLQFSFVLGIFVGRCRTFFAVFFCSWHLRWKAQDILLSFRCTVRVRCGPWVVWLPGLDRDTACPLTRAYAWDATLRVCTAGGYPRSRTMIRRRLIFSLGSTAQRDRSGRHPLSRFPLHIGARRTQGRGRPPQLMTPQAIYTKTAPLAINTKRTSRRRSAT